MPAQSMTGPSRRQWIRGSTQCVCASMAKAAVIYGEIVESSSDLLNKGDVISG